MKPNAAHEVWIVCRSFVELGEQLQADLPEKLFTAAPGRLPETRVHSWPKLQVYAELDEQLQAHFTTELLSKRYFVLICIHLLTAGVC